MVHASCTPQTSASIAFILFFISLAHRHLELKPWVLLNIHIRVMSLTMNSRWHRQSGLPPKKKLSFKNTQLNTKYVKQSATILDFGSQYSKNGSRNSQNGFTSIPLDVELTVERKTVVGKAVKNRQQVHDCNILRSNTCPYENCDISKS